MSRDPGSRRLAAVGLLSAAVVLLCRVGWVGPQRDLIALRQAELAQTRTAVARARRTAARLPAVTAEADRLDRRLDALRRALPAAREASAWLRRLQDAAAASQLTMRAFTPGTTRPDDRYVAWPVHLELTGRFRDVAGFLDRVARSPRLVTIGDLSIRTIDAGPPAATIAVACTATTYVLLDPPLPDAAAAAPANDAG